VSAAADLDQDLLAGVPLVDPGALPSALRDRLQSRIDRLGYLGDFFRIAAHQPAALAAFIDFTQAARSALPADLAEIVALTVATYTRNDYERHQHERLAIKLGLDTAWVQAVERLDPENEPLTAGQRAAQRWVIAGLKDHGHGSRTALTCLVEAIGPSPAVAVVLLTGRYIAHATLVNSFGMRPPVASIFDPDPASPGTPHGGTPTETASRRLGMELRQMGGWTAGSGQCGWPGPVRPRPVPARPGTTRTRRSRSAGQ
jgi:alkylhydroperoxidase family enzyme